MPSISSIERNNDGTWTIRGTDGSIVKKSGGEWLGPTASMVGLRCTKCERLLLETNGPVMQEIKIRCKRCGEWVVFEPKRPDEAK